MILWTGFSSPKDHVHAQCPSLHSLGDLKVSCQQKMNSPFYQAKPNNLLVFHSVPPLASLLRALPFLPPELALREAKGFGALQFGPNFTD